MVGVEVAVGGGVLEGIGVNVGVLVDGNDVADGVISDSVGVAVGTFEGRLQADRVKVRISTEIKSRNFITLSFCFIILYRNPADDNSLRSYKRNP
jgi:hypothetical protein